LGLIESIFLIFGGAAILSALALFARQPMLLAYILLGMILGPSALGWLSNAAVLNEIAEFGIIFLLFLVGLDLQPSKLRNLLTESMLTAVATSSVFFICATAIMLSFQFSLQDSAIIGLAMIFSSTILGIKLLPTTALHHRPIGETVISLLLIQDLLAIFALVFFDTLNPNSSDSPVGLRLLNIGLGLPALALSALLTVRYVIEPLIRRFDAFHEFIFLLAIGWCLAIATAAHWLGLSYAIGAVIAGISLATSPIALYIADNLKPLRDFFLVLFFFTVGAGINIAMLATLWAPVSILAIVLVLLKPPVFRWVLQNQSTPKPVAKEVGVRLGQASEFSLLVSYVAISAGLISTEAAFVLEAATVLTLLLSSYWVVTRYPSPVATDPALRRD